MSLFPKTSFDHIDWSSVTEAWETLRTSETSADVVEGTKSTKIYFFYLNDCDY